MKLKVSPPKKKVVGGTVGGGVTGAVGAWAGVAMAKLGASAVVPLSMKTFGTVVLGTGTFHWAPTTILQSFAATPIGFPVVIGGLVIGGAAGAWLTRK